MLNIKRILLPVDFPDTALRVFHQAAALAHHFNSEIVMVHVMADLSQEADVSETGASKLADWDMLAEITKVAEKNANHSLRSKLAGLATKCVLVKGHVARAIVQTAHKENTDLIMMPSHGHTFDQFLLGSVTAKVLNWTECPVWTDAHIEESPRQEFAIRRILCAVDFTLHKLKAVSWAVQMPPNLAPVLRWFTQLPVWSCGDRAAATSIPSSKRCLPAMQLNIWQNFSRI